MGQAKHHISVMTGVTTWGQVIYLAPFTLPLYTLAHWYWHAMVLGSRIDCWGGIVCQCLDIASLKVFTDMTK